MAWGPLLGQATGIASVADEVGVSRATVYRYFEDRNTLLRVAVYRSGVGLEPDRGPRVQTMLRSSLSLLLASQPHGSKRALRSLLHSRLMPALGLERS